MPEFLKVPVLDRLRNNASYDEQDRHLPATTTNNTKHPELDGSVGV